MQYRVILPHYSQNKSEQVPKCHFLNKLIPGTILKPATRRRMKTRRTPFAYMSIVGVALIRNVLATSGIFINNRYNKIHSLPL